MRIRRWVSRPVLPAPRSHCADTAATARVAAGEVFGAMVNRLARRRSFTTVLALALVLASSSAAALGLGQILLKSKLGEPLLAEIPIVTSDPAELEQLSAGLASPETFARIGLQPPDAIVANLRFTPALNNAGDPVIRITSAQPIDAPLLTFLVEVDWGQGRLVREYSTLLDAPRTVSAPLQPPIEAPAASASNAILRAPVVDEQADDLAAETAPAPDIAGVPPPPAIERPAPIAAADRSPATGRTSEYGAVQAGETLSQIARQLDLGAGLDQAMIALLRANPDAFINDNINLLKQGAVLRVPERSEVAALGAAQASALVRDHVQQWRAAQAPVPQPVSADLAAGGTAAADPVAANAATRGARLEIVPPGASRTLQAGTQSGISAGGEGDMLRQELQQTKETLAARDAELAEMQSRLAELEQLQDDQQQLISLKDSELSAVQQRLAQSQQAAPAATAEPAQNSGATWVLGGLGVLLLAAFALWWMRRKAPAGVVFRAPEPRTSSLADAFAPGQSSPLPQQPATAASLAPDDQIEVAAAPEPAPAAGVARAGPLPFWDRNDQPLATSDRLPGHAPEAAAPEAPAPAWHAAGSKPKLAMPAVVADVAPATGVVIQQRLELARAYLDLGDHESARQLLGEVAADGDATDRQNAMRMLRELE